MTKVDRTYWNQVMVQTFFEGNNLWYFIVQVETDDEGSDNTPDSTPASLASAKDINPIPRELWYPLKCFTSSPKLND